MFNHIPTISGYWPLRVLYTFSIQTMYSALWANALTTKVLTNERIAFFSRSIYSGTSKFYITCCSDRLKNKTWCSNILSSFIFVNLWNCVLTLVSWLYGNGEYIQINVLIWPKAEPSALFSHSWELSISFSDLPMSSHLELSLWYWWSQNVLRPVCFRIVSMALQVIDVAGWM